uniref:Uncharacterized protein n=1 Tax=Arundo donax TaxID=35708 RepID=A0A0A8Z5H0_ARUDO
MVVRFSSSWYGEGLFNGRLFRWTQWQWDKRFRYRSNGDSCASCGSDSLICAEEEAFLTCLIPLLHGRVRSQPIIYPAS